MKATELKKQIISLAQDIEFRYKNVDGSICPFSRENIAVSYGENYFNFTDIEELMKATILDGEAIQDVCENIIVY